MNYVELTYEAMNIKLESVQTECRYETIKLMNEGGDIDELDCGDRKLRGCLHFNLHQLNINLVNLKEN